MLPSTFNDIPAFLHSETVAYWENLTTKFDFSVANNENLMHSLPKILTCSPFIAKQCLQHPQLFQNLLQNGDLSRVYENSENFLEHLKQIPEECDDKLLMQHLRKWRNYEMVRIGWRDIAGWTTLEENLRDLSNLASTFVDYTAQRLYKDLTKRFGTPYNKLAEPQPFVIIAMGKLGGEELNFSSDIDLIFTYPNAGETQGGSSRTLDNQEFFIRLSQRLIQTLNSITPDGFVFRVDMRLRPFGESGPLAMNFNALEDYYQTHAREWERYALIKARVISGGEKFEKQIFKMLKPFVYRRYLDFSAFESLRDLKSQIDQEVKRKGNENNIKLGQGGIREIEFICQAFQLIRGGRQPALQIRYVLDVLERLKEYNFLPKETVEELKTAYRFLRKTEHRLQAIDDRQTQNLPSDPLTQQRLAFSVGFETWEEFYEALQIHRNKVQQHFKQFITGQQENSHKQIHASPEYSHAYNILKDVWLHIEYSEDINLQNLLQLLKECQFQEPEIILEQLFKLKASPALRHRSKQGQERLDILMPLLLVQVLTCGHQGIVLERVLKLIESVAKRSVYLALLIEHSLALIQLVHLCAESLWIADQISRYPLLLDELLDQRRLYDILNVNEIDNAIRAQLAHIPEEDLEMQMDSLRHFKRAQVLKVAAAELNEQLSLEKVSDHLTAIADAMIRQTLNIAWKQQVEKYGEPYCRDHDQHPESIRKAGFCVIAYGKAGGLEMSHSSDLDLVFLHDSRGGFQMTDGERQIDNNVFFSRLVTRIMHLLSTSTAAGTLYEVDPRLRPGGKSGLLVSSLEAFHDYQIHQAWTWEHQALIRARAVAGNEECIRHFNQIRKEVLSRPKPLEELKKEVQEMRQKMRDNLDKTNMKQFDLKQGVGGIADIEFIVQYNVLRYAHEFPDILNETSMLHLLRELKKHHLILTNIYDDLVTAYRTYRIKQHHLALQLQSAYVDVSEFNYHREKVAHWWQHFF
jgi:[glutamine synthetase] adenylyltransferase / [glutamine synthetase]-adenylyl-L-tyrosine phosphorylase